MVCTAFDEKTIKSNWSRLLCYYKDCKNSYNEKEEETHFFIFSQHENLCKMWLQACGREDLPALDYMGYYKTQRLCSKHFEDRIYMGPLKTRLLPTTVPKQFLPNKSIDIEVCDSEPPAKRICINEDVTGIPRPSIRRDGYCSTLFNVETQTSTVVSQRRKC